MKVALLQAAAWSGEHALALFALALGVVLVVALGWVARRQRRAQVPAQGWRAARLWRLLAGLLLGFVLVLAVCSLAFAALARHLRDDSALVQADRLFAAALAQHVPHEAIVWFARLTHLGDPSLLALLGLFVAGLLWRTGRRWLMLAWLLALVGNALLNPALKRVFERARPPFDASWHTAHGFSFPSGHSSGALVAYGMLAYLALRVLPPRWHGPAVALCCAAIVVTASSRVFIGVHFASDVVAGLLSGGAWLAACVASAEFARHWRRHRQPA